MREAGPAAARAFLPTVKEDAIEWIVRRLPSALACCLLSRVRRGRAGPVCVRSRRRAVRTAALLVAVAAFLVLPPQAEAQTVETLVNNLSEAITANTSVGGTSNVRQAQKFTVPTGQNYSLADVTIRVSTRGSDGLVVSIRDGSAADPPGTALYTLIPPASPGTGNQVYSAPAGAVLEGGNKYFVMLERAQNTGTSNVVSGTDANGQSGETGWSIADDRRERSGSTWNNNTHALKIRIRGSFSTYAAPPTHHEIWSATLTVAEISAGGSTFGYGFLDATSAGSLSQEEFTYYGTEYSILLFYRNTDTDPDLWLGLNPQGATAFDNEELSLVVDGTAFSFGDAVLNSTGQWVWAESGLNWADGDRAAVRLLGPPPPPVALVSATVSGTALTLTYDTGMDQTSVPAASAFTVDVDAATTTVSSVAVAGAEVTLTLASTPASTATVTVDYAVPATNPLRSLPAVIVPTFSDQPVAHVVNLVRNRSQAASFAQGLVGTLSGESLAVAQQFDTGGNAAGYLLASVDLDVDGVEANTDPRVSIYTKSGSNPGTLVHTLANSSSVADGWRTFTAPPGALLGKDTDYFVVVEHTRTTETFTIGLTASDAEDSGKADGWGIANTRRESVDGTWGAISSSDVVRIHVQGAIMPNRLATGAPAITGPATVGQTLAAATAGISDPDGTTKAEAGDTGYAYTYQWIRVDSDGSSNATDISGATGSTYVLASADEGKKIKLEAAFTDDADTDEGPLTSAAYPPTGTVAAGAANADPVFMDGASTMRDFDETIGDAAVATASNIGMAVAATDADLDTLTYSYSGADAARFGFVTTSGQLQTKVGEKYSYETDTSYSVTLTVTDGNGGSDSIDVTLNVADQDEPPLRPVAPEVNGHSTDEEKLLVTLTRPDNTNRPNISGYRIRLHAPGFGWSVLDWGTSVNQTVSSAISGARYTVQYRARNNEGEGPWSPSGFGSTRAHATGMPDITGAAEVTQTLTAGTSGISDGNGKSKAENGDVGFAYTYQWVRRVGGTDSNISGATSRTYTLASADEGNKVKVKARFTDNAGYAEGPLTSNAYPATGTIAPEPDPELSFANTNITVDEDAGTVTLTVELDPASAGTVTVDFATSDETALAGVDYTATSGTLTFAASETSKTISVPILDGINYETLRKRFKVTLSNATGATLPAVPDAQVNIRNDDAVPTVSLGDVTVDEGAGVMTLTLALSYLSSEDITYRITHGGVSGTATVTDDYVAFLQGGVQTFTVPAGHMSATFDITIVDDSLDEPDETILIEWDLSISSSAMPAFFDFTGTITDNDTAGVTLSKSTLTVTEEDTTGDTYTVVLDTLPTANVTVTVAGHAGTDVTATSTPLTFTTVNWSTAQVVTVTAADDADTTDDTVVLTHSAASTDSDYDGITIDGVTVTVEDNDSTAAVTPPALVSATVSGTALTLTYDKNLDEDSVPAAGAYAVDVDSTAVTVSSVAVDGIEATLTLASTATSTATTTVDYVVPATNPLRSTAEVDAPAFAGQPVAHIVDLVRNRSQAAAGSDGVVGTVPGLGVYAAAQQFDTGGNAAGYLLDSVLLDVRSVEANGDPQVSIYTTSGSNPGTLVHTLSNPSGLADGWRTFTAPPGALLDKDTDYFVVAEHTRTTNTFTLTLTASDAEDPGKADGWGIADSRRRSVDGTWGAAPNSNVIRIQVQGAIVPNRVATGAPTITGTAAVGETLTAATAGISDADGTTKAEAGDTGYAYTYQWIRVDSDGSSNATDIPGATATSTYVLVSADEGKKIKVEVAFADDADNDEGPLTSAAYPATGTVAATSTAPVFDDGANTAREFAESVGDANEQSATLDDIGAAVSATDADMDTLEYSLEGTDAGRFSIVPGSGQITTKVGENYDYETSTSYAVTVKAVDGNGGEATIGVTIGVTDVDEPPQGVQDLRAVLRSRTSFNVEWNTRGNTGRPPITHHILRHRAGGGPYTTLTSPGSGTSASITGLAPGTRYEWNVRAINDDGGSPWSVPASDATRPNAPPVFPGPTTTRTLAETVGDATVDQFAIIGAAVEAQDADMDTLLYSIGGPDFGRFAFSPSNGSIAVVVGERYDYEAQQSYEVTVTAEDPFGATDTITVTIEIANDTNEQPLQMSAPSVTATSGSATSLDASWSEPGNVGRPLIDSYDLRHKKTLDTSWTNSPQNVTGTSAAIGALEEDTEYQVAVRATNEDGNGLWSQATAATTGDDANRAPVFDDGARTRRTLSETLGGTPPTSGQPVGQPVAASDADNDPLEYSLEGADAGRFTVAPGTGQIRTLANTVYDYEVRQSYAVVVNVEDGHGGSDTIEVTLAVEDQVEAPRPVSQPTVTTLGATSLRVSWTAPENVGRPAITGYDVRHVTSGVSATQRVTGTSVTLTGLEPDTRYFVDVRAVNADGPSQHWSIPRSGNTAPVLVTFGASSYTATEGGAAATVTVALSEAMGSSTTIPLTPTNRGGATNADYTGVPPNVTFGAAQTSTTFTVTAVDDSDNDRGESVRIGFGTLPPGVAAGSPATATVALEDDDAWQPPTVSFGAATYTATEGGGAVTVTVEVDRAEVPFTLPLTTDGQGGATSSDYSGVPTSVVFRGSDTAKSFTVTAVDDEVNDDGESVVIGIGAPLPEGLSLRIGSPSEATVELVDNDVPSASGALRLAQGGGVYGGSYGRLQVYHDGQWGLVCEGNFGREEAQVACRQLGFADGEEGYGGAGSGGLPFWLKGVRCQGTESRLVNCSHRGLQEHSCGSFDITGVECSRTPLSVLDARVAGALLTLVYDAALDGGSVPSGGDFVVLAGPPGSAAAVTVTAVSVGDDTVALTLARPVLPDETVRLSYLVAPMHPVQDASGVPAAPLPDMAVRNETPPSTDAVDAVVSPAEIGELAARRPSADLSPWLADGGASAPLGRLDLSSRAVADVSALAGLTELRVLNLGDNAVADLAPLSGLTGLRVLDLSSNAVADVGPLAGLTGLERLDLSGNRIADVSALSGLTRLEVLRLDGNRIDDALPLWSLQGLVRLGLADNRIDDVGLLAELRSLQRLDLTGNRVSDVSPLGDLSELVWLRLPGNPVSDAAPLGRLTGLRWLWLDVSPDAGGGRVRVFRSDGTPVGE